jgi:hypothetical protein
MTHKGTVAGLASKRGEVLLCWKIRVGEPDRGYLLSRRVWEAHGQNDPVRSPTDAELWLQHPNADPPEADLWHVHVGTIWGQRVEIATYFTSWYALGFLWQSGGTVVVDRSAALWPNAPPPPTTLWVAGIPYWFVIAVAALPAAAYILQMAHRHGDTGPSCRSCGYDMRASTGRCPECGSIISRMVHYQTPGVSCPCRRYSPHRPALYLISLGSPFRSMTLTVSGSPFS